MAANTLLRYILAAVLPLFMKTSKLSRHSSQIINLLTQVSVYSDLGVTGASSLLGFICLVFVPLPWALFRYGPWLRARSRYVSTECQYQVIASTG
jgi:hypothetical protein